MNAIKYGTFNGYIKKANVMYHLSLILNICQKHCKFNCRFIITYFTMYTCCIVPFGHFFRINPSFAVKKITGNSYSRPREIKSPKSYHISEIAIFSENTSIVGKKRLLEWFQKFDFENGKFLVFNKENNLKLLHHVHVYEPVKTTADVSY